MVKENQEMIVITAIVSLISLVGLAYIYVSPPEYLKSDRDGVPYFTPQVLNPETGEGVEMGELIRHFKGE